MRRFLFFVSRLFCLGDPNVGTRLRSLHVRSVLRRLVWDSVLDAGCSLSGQVGWGGGIALNPFLLAIFNPSRLVTESDIDRGSISRNRSLLSSTHVANLSFSVLDLADPNNRPNQDAVVLSDVIANRDGDLKLLVGASKLTRPGGHIVVHTISRLPSHEVQTGQVMVGSTGYSIAELEQALRSVGASNIHIKYTFGLFGGLAWRLHDRFLPLGYPFAVLMFPSCFLIGLWDLLVRNRTGRGLLAVGHIGSDGMECKCSQWH